MKKEFKQVTVAGKIYQWNYKQPEFSTAYSVYVFKDGVKIIDDTIIKKPTSAIMRELITKYLQNIKPVKVIKNDTYGTLGSKYLDIKFNL
jgi:hypothetical protein